MTQVFREDGTIVPVTRVKAGPCVVTQVKTQEKQGVAAVQVGYGVQKQYRLSKAEQGHLQGLQTVQFLRDFRTDDAHGLERGNTFTVQIFTPGEKVQVTGSSKGKGFQGVVKRHGFSGSPKTHGHKDQVRMPGSIGATGPQRVFKGTRMGGHMGDDRVTVKNLEIVDVLLEENELLIKGAIPGARGNLLLISTQEGMIEVQKMPASEEVIAPTEVVSSETPVEEVVAPIDAKEDASVTQTQ